MNKSTSICVIAAITTIFMPGVSAQGNASGSAVIEEVTVTAQRRTESLSETPVSITALTPEVLEKQQILTEADLQAAVPGLTVRTSRSQTELNFSLRGQTIDGFTDSFPGVVPYLNEVPLSQLGTSAFFDLESIQVLKGPQGTLFGRNATGGAVLYTTAKPGPEFGGYISAGAGNYDQRRVEGALNAPLLGEDAIIRVAGFYKDRDGWQTNLLDGSHPGANEQTGLRASLRNRLTDNLTNDLVVNYLKDDSLGVISIPVISNNESFYPGSLISPEFLYSPGIDFLFGPGFWNNYVANTPGATPGGWAEHALQIQPARGPYTVHTDVRSEQEVESVILTNITTWDVWENAQIRNIIGYSNYDSEGQFEVDGTPYGVYDVIGNRRDQEHFSEELQLQATAFDGALEYVVGIYYSEKDSETQALSNGALKDLFGEVPSYRTNAKLTDETLGVYAQGTYDLGGLTGLEGLSFTAGLRYSDTKNDIEYGEGSVGPAALGFPPDAGTSLPALNSDKVSYSVGLEYQASDSTMLYVKTRESFRSGGYSTFGPHAPGFGEDNGAAFKPETLEDIELGLKFSGLVGDMPARLNVAAFFSEVENAQRAVYVNIGGTPNAVVANVPKSEADGVELDGQIWVTDWLTVGGNLAHTDADFGSEPVDFPTLFTGPVTFGPYPDTPEWSGSVFAEARMTVFDRLTASIFGSYYSQSKTYIGSTVGTLTPGGFIPSYELANFRVAIEDESAGWTLSVNLKNAFDETYYTGGIVANNIVGYNTETPGDRRRVTVDLRYDF